MKRLIAFDISSALRLEYIEQIYKHIIENYTEQVDFVLFDMEIKPYVPNQQIISQGRGGIDFENLKTYSNNYDKVMIISDWIGLHLSEKVDTFNSNVYQADAYCLCEDINLGQLLKNSSGCSGKLVYINKFMDES